MIVVNYQNGCLLQPQKDRSKASYDLGPAFWIEKIVQYPNSNMGTRFIFGYNDHNSISGEFEIEAAECYDYRFGLLSMLAKHGLIYDPSWDRALNAYFHNEIRRVTKGRPKEYRHTTLGWRKDNGSYKFFYDVTPLGAYNSRYYDTNFSFKSGSDAVYKKLLDEVVWPCPTLTLAMAIGFSSVVNSRMQDLLAPESILFNLCGASSTGKTTAEMLMVSAFAKPIPSNSSGLIHTFNSTENALYAAIANIHGLPMVLDDTTTNTSLNLPRLLYSLSSNQDKARCTQDGSLKPSTRDWSGTIILSSETPIHELQSENQGLKVRVLHTQGITWTPDAQTAERIKNVVQNNYGHIGYGFAKYVESLDDNNLLNRHTTALNAIKPLMAKKDGLTDRIAAKYAIVGMTLTLMKERFGLTIDENDLMSILIQCEQESFESRDIAQPKSS